MARKHAEERSGGAFPPPGFVGSTGDGLEPPEVNRISCFLRGITKVVTHHGAPLEVVHSLHKQVVTYLRGLTEPEFLSRAKFLLLQPMAKFLRNDLPKMPSPFRWRGRFRKWMKSRMVYTRRNVHLWYSFLQAKRAAAPVSIDIVYSTYEKHRAQMELEDPLDCESGHALLTEIMDLLNPVIQKIRSKIEPRLRKFWKHPEKVSHAASRSASLSTGRSQGGAAAYLQGLVPGSELRTSVAESFMDRRPDLVSMQEQVGRFRRGREIVENPVLSTVEHTGELEQLSSEISKWIENFEDRPLMARVAAIIEPFKVRTVTAEEEVPQYLGKPVQEEIHSAMREMPCFRLIGRPLQATDVCDVRACHARLFPEAEEDEKQWISIDYSAATDGLSASLSRAILGELLSGLEPINPRFTRLMMRVLAPHTVCYPEVKGKPQLPIVQQRNGQLMGSILSFPVLCLANLGLALRVITERLEFKKGVYRNLLGSILVNGDDMLYIGGRADWELHKSLGRAVGLEMSPGKAYIHPRYANVNSTSLDCDLTDDSSTPSVVGFLNTGLFFGQHKVMARIGDLGEDEWYKSPYISVITKVWEGAWPRQRCRLLAEYLSLHASEIRRESQGRNLFLPVSIGGHGQAMPDGFRNVLSKEQEMIASAVLQQPFMVIDERPLPEGRVIQDVSDRVLDPFRPVPKAATVRRWKKSTVAPPKKWYFGAVLYDERPSKLPFFGPELMDLDTHPEGMVIEEMSPGSGSSAPGLEMEVEPGL